MSSYTTPQDRARRRAATAVLIVVVAVVVGWISAISALAGGGAGPPQGGADGSEGDRSGQEQAAAGETTAEEDAEPAQQDSDGDEPGAGESRQPPVGGGADQQHEGTGEAQTQEVFDPLQEEGQQRDGSSGGGQQGQAVLDDTERTRARAAVERYITAAYGYTGQSEDDYLEAIEQAASDEIYDSPGGSKLEEYARAAPECGMKSMAILEEFEVVPRSPDGLDVAVAFSVEDADGQTHTFSQDQRLTSSNGVYEVSGVSVEELISETTPEQSCPGAQPEEPSSGTDEAVARPSVSGTVDEDRAKAAADRYITAAYGYTGGSGKEYRERVGRAVDEETFYSSPGGKRVRGYAEAATEKGITAAAVMESFEITSTEDSTVEGTAYFRVGREYDRYAELRGQTTPFAIDLALSEARSSYEVSRAGAEREVSGREIVADAQKRTS